jgi:hypothetical protein
MRLKWIVSLAMGFMFATPFIGRCVAHAQSKTDEASVRNVPQAFAAAWAKHDGQQLAKIMSENVDFVDVAGDWLHGRSDFALYHRRATRPLDHKRAHRRGGFADELPKSSKTQPVGAAKSSTAMLNTFAFISPTIYK